MFEKVIFLDVDGVLNGKNSKSYCITEDGRIITGIDTDKVKRLARIENDSKADIVLISSWKDGWYNSNGYLFTEPSLSNHAKYDFYEHDEIMRHWVKTDYDVGLTDDDATAAINILKGQLIGPFEKKQESECY